MTLTYAIPTRRQCETTDKARTNRRTCRHSGLGTGGQRVGHEVAFFPQPRDQPEPDSRGLSHYNRSSNKNYPQEIPHRESWG